MESFINSAVTFETVTHPRHGKHPASSKPETKGTVRERKARVRQTTKKSWELRRTRERDLRHHKALVSGEDTAEMEGKYQAASMLWYELSYIEDDLEEFINSAYEESQYEAGCTCKNKYKVAYCWDCIKKYYDTYYSHELAVATEKANLRIAELKEKLKTVFDD